MEVANAEVMWLLFVLALGLNIAHARKATWNLSIDLRKTNNQISFNQGSNGVWYLMESASLRHVPSIYSMLPDYSAPCKGNPADVFDKWTGMLAGPDAYDRPCSTSGASILRENRIPTTGAWASGSLGCSASRSRSVRHCCVEKPLNAIVSITGSFTDLNSSCGNGVLWFIDRNSHRLASGDLANGGAESFSLPSVVVSEGQVLYFIVDPKNGDYGCDSTMLDLNIAEAE